jgi:hypothetical protein
MENKEFSLKNYEDYKDYYEDATKEEIIADTYADYLAYGNTLQELSIANDKLKKIEEYITSYESISTIQGLNDTKENKNLDKNTMVEMTNRYLKVHDKILSIIKGDD